MYIKLNPTLYLVVLPPQEPENVADDHREQIINNLSDEDIPLPSAP
jgi:hypothetical protein